MSDTNSPLARLVLFIVGLSIAGSFVAGLHYVAVDLPQQQNVQAPANGCTYSYGACTYEYINNRWVSLCCLKDCCTSTAEMSSALPWID